MQLAEFAERMKTLEQMTRRLAQDSGRPATEVAEVLKHRVKRLSSNRTTSAPETGALVRGSKK